MELDEKETLKQKLFDDSKERIRIFGESFAVNEHPDRRVFLLSNEFNSQMPGLMAVHPFVEEIYSMEEAEGIVPGNNTILYDPEMIRILSTTQARDKAVDEDPEWLGRIKSEMTAKEFLEPITELSKKGKVLLTTPIATSIKLRLLAQEYGATGWIVPMKFGGDYETLVRAQFKDRESPNPEIMNYEAIEKVRHNKPSHSIVVLGYSGSGKSTLLSYLRAHNVGDLPTLTTRHKRVTVDPETISISEEEFNHINREGGLIGVHEYFGNGYGFKVEEIQRSTDFPYHNVATTNLLDVALELKSYNPKIQIAVVAPLLDMVGMGLEERLERLKSSGVDDETAVRTISDTKKRLEHAMRNAILTNEFVKHADIVLRGYTPQENAEELLRYLYGTT